jgi:quercetin dioxygenase-like cupin family protein
MDLNEFIYKKSLSDEKKIIENWGRLTWLANHDVLNTKGVTVGLVHIKKGMSNPRHRHPNCEEVLYLLNGRLEHSIGCDKIIVESGDSILIKADVVHNAISIGECDADMIVAYSSPVRQTIGE